MKLKCNKILAPTKALCLALVLLLLLLLQFNLIISLCYDCSKIRSTPHTNKCNFVVFYDATAAAVYRTIVLSPF